MKQFIVVTSLTLALLACNNTTNNKPIYTGKPALAGKWLIATITEQAVITSSFPTLTFDKSLSLSGQLSCNNFLTRYQLDNKNLSIGPITTTRKICPSELMQQESKLLSLLTTVKRFELDKDQLTLLDNQGRAQLKAKRVKRSILVQ